MALLNGKKKKSISKQNKGVGCTGKKKEEKNIPQVSSIKPDALGEKALFYANFLTNQILTGKMCILIFDECINFI